MLAEQKQLVEEKRLAEQKRLTEEKQLAEQKKLAEEKRLVEEKNLSIEKGLSLDLYRRYISIKVEVSIEYFESEIQELIANQASMDRVVYLNKMKGTNNTILLILM